MRSLVREKPVYRHRVSVELMEQMLPYLRVTSAQVQLSAQTLCTVFHVRDVDADTFDVLIECQDTEKSSWPFCCEIYQDREKTCLVFRRLPSAHAGNPAKTCGWQEDDYRYFFWVDHREFTFDKE